MIPFLLLAVLLLLLAVDAFTDWLTRPSALFRKKENQQ